MLARTSASVTGTWNLRSSSAYVSQAVTSRATLGDCSHSCSSTATHTSRARSVPVLYRSCTVFCAISSTVSSRCEDCSTSSIRCGKTWRTKCVLGSVASVVVCDSVTSANNRSSSVAMSRNRSRAWAGVRMPGRSSVSSSSSGRGTVGAIASCSYTRSCAGCSPGGPIRSMSGRVVL